MPGPPNARVGDMVTMTSPCNGGCNSCPHPWSGIIKSGAQTINNIPAARVTDTGQCICPHAGTFQIIKGSGTVEINGQKVARIGDQVQCQKCGAMGLITVGSPNTMSGG